MFYFDYPDELLLESALPYTNILFLRLISSGGSKSHTKYIFVSFLFHTW